MVKMGGHRGKEGKELVTLIEREFTEAVNAHRKDMTLMEEAWNAYVNFEGSLWDPVKKQKLIDQKRDIRVFEVVAPKVDTLAGALVSELPDLDWIPVEGEKTSTTESIKDSWYTDKELTNTEYEMMLGIRDGLVHIGWVRLCENNKYGKPVLGLERIEPGHLIPSAYWTHNSDRKLNCVFVIGYLTPEEIMFKYRTKIFEIKQAMEDIKSYGKQELPYSADTQRKNYENRISDHYKIIEKHWIEHVETSRLVGPKIEINQVTGEPTGIVRWVPFPVTDNREIIQSYAEQNNIPLKYAEEVPYTDTVHWVTTVCPELSPNIVLENAKSKIQVQGLPFYHFTVMRHNGRNKGIAAALLDPARTISEREALVTELISKANGGERLADKNVFGSRKDRDEFVRNHNNPNHTQFVDFSMSQTGRIVENVPPAQYPSQVLDQISRMYDVVVPMTSRVSDSMSAISQPGKSGVLFDKEITVNRIANYLMNMAIKNFMDHIAEGYFFQWQITYAGIERQVNSRDGKKKVILNERVIGDDGREMIRNHVGYVPRCRALVTESAKSPTSQMRNRMLYSDILQTINPQVNPEHYNFMFTQYMSTMDLPEKIKAELEALNKQLDIKAKMNFVAQIMQLHAGTKMASVQAAQMDIQLQQIMAQLQEMGGMQNPAQPVVPEQLTDATEGMDEPQADMQPAVEEEQQPVMGSDME